MENKLTEGKVKSNIKLNQKNTKIYLPPPSPKAKNYLYEKLKTMTQKQTAVEFLKEKLTSVFINDIGFNKLFEEAKQMEKEQIIEAVNQIEFEDEDGFGISENITKGEQYYNETYGSKGSDVAKRMIKEMPKHVADYVDDYADKLVKSSKTEKSEKPINLTSSQTEISDEEIEKRVKEVGAMGEFYKIGYRDAIIWYREQLKQRQ